MRLNDSKKSSRKGKSKAARNGILKLLVFIACLYLFMFYAAPLIDRLPLVQPLVSYIDKNNIDASALYYTEIEEFSRAEANVNNTMKYTPKGPVRITKK